MGNAVMKSNFLSGRVEKLGEMGVIQSCKALAFLYIFNEQFNSSVERIVLHLEELSFTHHGIISYAIA